MPTYLKYIYIFFSFRTKVGSEEKSFGSSSLGKTKENKKIKKKLYKLTEKIRIRINYQIIYPGCYLFSSRRAGHIEIKITHSLSAEHVEVVHAGVQKRRVEQLLELDVLPKVKVTAGPVMMELVRAKVGLVVGLHVAKLFEQVVEVLEQKEIK